MEEMKNLLLCVPNLRFLHVPKLYPIFYLLIHITLHSDHLLDQNLKEEATTAVEQLHEAESEAKALKTMTQRMILTHEEMVAL